MKSVLTNKVDLILLDIMMPGMDGYSVFARLRAEPLTQKIPVIFVTALDLEQHEIVGLDMGAVDYLTKPINPDITKLRIRNQLELKRARDHFEKLATIDGLTGIFNRRHFDELFTQEWQRSRRSGSLLSILLMDIDYFKLFNDNYGHGAGDDCLRKVAGCLSGRLERATDIVARYGGEEFVCLLPETNRDGARHIGERLRSCIAALKIPHAHSPSADHITISIGGATIKPEKTTSPQDLLNLSDQRLYEAKRLGRNRLVHG